MLCLYTIENHFDSSPPPLLPSPLLPSPPLTLPSPSPPLPSPSPPLPFPLPPQGHKRGNSYNSICAFVQPESSLETSLVRHSSQVHAHPISMAERKTGGNKGSISQASHTSQDSVEGYVAVEDDQYIVIEASPSSENSSRSSQSSQQVLGVALTLCSGWYSLTLWCT